jgi:hypothetical protein
MTTIDIEQDVSILWNRGVIINTQKMENKDLNLRFYDLQTLKFFNTVTIPFKSFDRDEDDFSDLKLIFDFKRAFIYVHSRMELKGYSLIKIKKDDTFEVLADQRIVCKFEDHKSEK